MSMPAVTRATGAVLIGVGVLGYLFSGAASVTALLPAVLGLIVLALGLAARREQLRKHAVHAALVVAVLGLLGSLPRVGGVFTLLGGGSVERPIAAVASLATVVVCAVFIALGVRSFIAARRGRAVPAQ